MRRKPSSAARAAARPCCALFERSKTSPLHAWDPSSETRRSQPACAMPTSIPSSVATRWKSVKASKDARLYRARHEHRRSDCRTCLGTASQSATCSFAARGGRQLLRATAPIPLHRRRGTLCFRRRRRHDRIPWVPANHRPQQGPSASRVRVDQLRSTSRTSRSRTRGRNGSLHRCRASQVGLRPLSSGVASPVLRSPLRICCSKTRARRQWQVPYDVAFVPIPSAPPAVREEQRREPVPLIPLPTG